MTRTPDGREYIQVHSHGYMYTLVKSEPRYGTIFPMPNFMGYKGFGLRACKKISTYKLNQLKFQL